MRPRDTGLQASIKQRLLNLAHARGEEFEQVLVRFVAERFLYRLSRSRYAENFVLKGAMLFIAWEGMPHRVTRDIDLLGTDPPSVEGMTGIMRDIASTQVDEDGLAFDISGVLAEEIRAATIHRGVRVFTRATIGTARVPLQIDVGFGDAVTPGPELVTFPSLLDHPQAQLRAYPVDTVIAEKALAIVERGLLNTRMKDYFDLMHLARTRSFEAARLSSALSASAARRGVKIPPGPVAGISDGFSSDPSKQAQWRGFCSRIRLGPQIPPLEAVVRSLAAFLAPIFDASSRGSVEAGTWLPGGPWRWRD